MNIQVTLNANPDFLQVLQTIANAMTGQVKAAPVAKEKKQITAPAEESVAGPALAMAEEAPAAPVAQSTISIEQIRAAVKTKSEGGKRDQIKGLLAEFGADKVTALDKAHYADFKTKLEAL